MEFSVSNDIRVRYDPLLDNLLERLELSNPDYYKLERMGKWLGNTPKTIRLYERIGDEVVFPFGCLQELWRMFPNQYVWHTQFAPIRAFDYESGINLYQYQQKAEREALYVKNGVLLMPCGSGKTQTGLAIIANIGGRALWLTHTQDLLNQSKKRAKEVFGCGGFGTITAGKVDVGEGITFATVQTMAKLDLQAYRDTWDIVVVDECQHCAGSPTRVTQFYKVVSNLSARYKIGLTATLHRSDGLERAVTALLGGIIYEVTKQDVGERTCPVVVEDIETGFYPDVLEITQSDGTLDYHKLIEVLVEDEARFKVVSDVIQGKTRMLVLANRVEYLERLKDAFDGRSVCISGKGQSKKAKQERREALEKLNDGELDAVFATYQLAAEGLDVPNLRYVAFTTPEHNKTTVTQAAGRVSRAADGKEYGTVIDFVDDFEMYRGWKKQRNKIFSTLVGNCH